MSSHIAVYGKTCLNSHLELHGQIVHLLNLCVTIMVKKYTVYTSLNSHLELVVTCCKQPLCNPSVQIHVLF